MPQGQFLRNHSAHRNAEDVRPWKVQRLEQARRIIGHLRHAVRTQRLIRFTNAAIIEADRLEMRRERG